MRLPLEAQLSDIFDEVSRLSAGEVADYIPALSAANPDWLGVSMLTVDNHRYDMGDTTQTFTIQSVSKPFAFAMALEQHGIDAVLQRVGVEPSGDPFNSIELDMTTLRPHNPMVNAGAIVTTSLLTPDRIDEGFARFAGRALPVDDEVWRSELDTGDRNRAIAYLMHSFGMLGTDVDPTLRAYFRQCSLLIDTHDLATMGATLANRGVNPITGERAVSEVNVSRVLSVMSTCGMYDYAGAWLYNVGLPAKSGVSGAVLAVLPGQFGLAVFSPRLDEHGNSVRGIRFCEAVSERFHLHLFRPPAPDLSVVRRTYGADAVRSKRQRLAVQDTALKSAGATTRVIELQGQLRFGSAEVLSRAVAAELSAAEVIILDFHRVSAVDGSGPTLLAAIENMVAGQGATLVLASAPTHVAQTLAAMSFDALDAALEWREEQLLESANLHGGSARIPLAEVEMLQDIDTAFLPALEAAGTYRSFGAGEMVFLEGDPADRMYLLVAGSVDIVFAAGDSLLRATTFGPGSTFGDMAALFGGTRTAGVRAAEASVCFELQVGALRELCVGRPDVLLQIHTNIARALANRVRRLSDEVRALN